MSFLLCLRVMPGDVLKTIYNSQADVFIPVKILINFFALSSLICLEVFQKYVL